MYTIHKQNLLLGRIFSEVKAEAKSVIQNKSYGGWHDLRIKCRSVFDFKTTERELRAPREDRPIMQESYELKPYDKSLYKNDPSFWADQLIEYFGEPSKVSVRESNLASSVVYCAEWLVDNIELTLSVYGGIRKSESGLAAAALFFDLSNEIEIAKPFLEEMNATEEYLWDNLKLPLSFFKNYVTKVKMKPYCLPDYSSKNPYDVYQNPLLRKSQKALYCPELLETPKVIAERIPDEYTIALWTCRERYFISNQWDTAEIGDSRVSLQHLLPARGAGAMILNIGPFRINDVHDSSVLPEIAEFLQKQLLIAIKQTESYDY